MALVMQARELSRNPTEFKEKAQEANKRLAELKKARMLSKSYAAQEAKKYLRKMKRKEFSENPFAGKEGKPDKKHTDYSNALTILNFLESKSSTASELVAILENKRTNIINQLVENTYASQADKDTLREFLEGISPRQFDRLLGIYEPVLANSFIRGSDDKFQVIGNHMISQATKAQNRTFSQIGNQLLNEAKEVKEGIGIVNNAIDTIENPLEKAKSMLLNDYIKNLPTDGMTDVEITERADNLYYVYGGNVNGIIKRKIISQITDNPIDRDIYENVLNVITKNKGMSNVFLGLVKKSGFINAEAIQDAADKIIGYDEDKNSFHLPAGKIAVDVVKNLIMSGGNVFAAIPGIVKDTVVDLAEESVSALSKQSAKDTKKQKKQFKTERDVNKFLFENIANIEISSGTSLFEKADPVDVAAMSIEEKAKMFGTTATAKPLQKKKRKKTISVQDLKKGLGI